MLMRRTAYSEIYIHSMIWASDFLLAKPTVFCIKRPV